jgi:hypothetical protein
MLIKRVRDVLSTVHTTSTAAWFSPSVPVVLEFVLTHGNSHYVNNVVDVKQTLMCSDDCSGVFVRPTALVSAVRQRLFGHQLANIPQVQLSYKGRLEAYVTLHKNRDCPSCRSSLSA